MKYDMIKMYQEDKFREVTGVTRTTFDAMLEVVKEAYIEVHKKHGRHRKLSLEDMLMMFFEYYKEYRTMQCIGSSFGLSKTNVSKVIRWIEEILIKSNLFKLPGKKVLVDENSGIEIIAVDTTEIAIERPKVNQRAHYSGKKKDTPRNFRS